VLIEYSDNNSALLPLELHMMNPVKFVSRYISQRLSTPPENGNDGLKCI